MKNLFLYLYVIFQDLKNGESGQDLVEYALLVLLIALACMAGIGYIANGLNAAFSNVSASLA